MIIIWLLSGIAAVSVAFFIPPVSSEFWPSLNLAAIPLIVYSIALAAFTIRSPISLTARIAAWVFVAAVGVATYSAWSGMDEECHWQHDRLLGIQTVVTRGILRSSATTILLNVLDEYHKQGMKKKESLGVVFGRLNNGATLGADIYKSQNPSDSCSIIVRAVSNDSVLLVGLHSFSHGRDPKFGNYDGRRGRVQEQFTLTEKGISYVTEN